MHNKKQEFDKNLKTELTKKLADALEKQIKERAQKTVREKSLDIGKSKGNLIKTSSRIGTASKNNILAKLISPGTERVSPMRKCKDCKKIY